MLEAGGVRLQPAGCRLLFCEGRRPPAVNLRHTTTELYTAVCSQSAVWSGGSSILTWQIATARLEFHNSKAES